MSQSHKIIISRLMSNLERAIKNTDFSYSSMNEAEQKVKALASNICDHEWKVSGWVESWGEGEAFDVELAFIYRPCATKSKLEYERGGADFHVSLNRDGSINSESAIIAASEGLYSAFESMSDRSDEMYY